MNASPVLTLNILVVEDNQVNQLIARRFLEQEGHHVVLAANGRQAVELFFREAFDLVFMDVQMPEMDGLEATATIRAGELEAERRRTPIIALTTLARPEDRQACFDAGMDHYVGKPIDRSALSRAVLLAASRLGANSA